MNYGNQNSYNSHPPWSRVWKFRLKSNWEAHHMPNKNKTKRKGGVVERFILPQITWSVHSMAQTNDLQPSDLLLCLLYSATGSSWYIKNHFKFNTKPKCTRWHTLLRNFCQLLRRGDSSAGNIQSVINSQWPKFLL